MTLSARKVFSPVWVNRCLFKSEIKDNSLGHWAQEKRFSPVWVNRCLFKSELKKSLGHCLHNYYMIFKTLISSKCLCTMTVFSPVCVTKWIFNVDLLENVPLHILQGKCFLPVWHFKWVVKAGAYVNGF